jgi:hypothetical protein
MGRRLNPKNRPARQATRRADSPGKAALHSFDPSLQETPRPKRTKATSLIARLAPHIGNEAVLRLLEKDRQTTVASILARNLLQRDGDGGGGGTPPVKTPAKTMIDKAKSVEVLGAAFKDYVKEVKEGSVEVLAQADFQAAYDKIYGKTDYSWAKYVAPGPGNLEGFAYKGVNYINKDIGSIDVVPHEMLHNNSSPSWNKTDEFAGSELNEGATEYLTIKAVTLAKYTPSHSYPDQEGVVQELVKMTSEALLMGAYFKGETAALKTEMEKKCVGSWAQFKTAMQAKDWAKAKAYLKAKP